MLAGARGGVAGRPAVRSVPAWISRDSAENTSAMDAEKCYSTICEHTGTISPGRADRQGDFGQRGGGRPRRAARSRGSAARGPRAGRAARRQPDHGCGRLRRPAPPGHHRRGRPGGHPHPRRSPGQLAGVPQRPGRHQGPDHRRPGPGPAPAAARLAGQASGPDVRRGAGRAAAVPRRYPATGVIEDDHAGPVAGVPGFTAAAGLGRWVTLRSVSKSLGPDLRLAVVAGDEATITRVAGRQALGTGWVSYQLQEMVADLWSDAAVARILAEAARVYAGRGAALRAALAAHGITASGRSGFTCWVSVADEDGVAAALLRGGDLQRSPRGAMAATGWAV